MTNHRQLIVAVLLMGTSIQGQDSPRLKVHGVTSTYYFPFACSLTVIKDQKYEFIGSGSILTSNYVVFAVENLEATDIDVCPLSVPICNSRGPVIYPASRIIVFAGVDVPTPISVVTEYNIEYRQIRLGKQLFIAKSKEFSTENISKDPPKLAMEFTKSVYGFPEMDLGLLFINSPFTWTSQVLPVPVGTYGRTQRSTEASIYYAKELHPDSGEPCVVAGWGHSEADPRLVFYELQYVRFEDCVETICQDQPDYCLRYPIEKQHVCFKSLSFGGPCHKDQGAAVYCTETKEIFAFLAKTFDCGFRSMPSIYTLASYTVDMATTLEGKERLEPRQFYGLYQPNWEVTTTPPLLTSDRSPLESYEYYEMFPQAPAPEER